VVARPKVPWSTLALPTLWQVVRRANVATLQPTRDPVALIYCVRDHRRRPTDNRTCAECHRERARLQARLVRVIRLLQQHEGVCRLPRAACPTRGELERRIGVRYRALEAWRALGMAKVG